MKKIAFALLIVGFLFGTYVAALDEKLVDWTLFAFGAVAAIIGVILAKRADAEAARSGAVLENNRNALNESLTGIVNALESRAADATVATTDVLEWIDSTLRNDLRRFAEARESMVHLYGLQAYADIMSEFAAGERYINRVWSSAADGYYGEAERYLNRAVEQFRHAQSQLAAVART